MKKLSLAAILALTCVFVRGADIYLAGDSTMCDYAKGYAPQQGWGHMLQDLCKPDVKVVNLAAGGRSVKSFRNEKRWEKLLSQVKKGDYVVIQFGINDNNKRDKSRYANFRDEFPELLTKCVKEAREKGAIPVLVSPQVRWAFYKDKKRLYNGSHSAYRGAVEKVAKAEDVILVNINKIAYKKLIDMGPDATKKYYMVATGKKDNLHITEEGAKAYAQWFVDDVKAQKLPMAALFK